MKNKSNTIRNALVGTALLVVAYIVYTQFITFPVSQEFVSWEQGGSIVDTAKINEPVTLNLNIYSNSLIGYSGTIKVQIKKDVPGTDKVVTTKSVSVNIPMGLDKKQPIEVKFTPDENAGSLLDTCKEYFYKVYLGDKAIYDPTTSGDRNGLYVGSKAAGGTVPKVTGILFNDKPQITVSPGTSISTKVKMSGTGTGQLKVEIRKDVPLLTDSSYTTLTKDVTIEDSGIIDMNAWTANEQGVGFREYFARVSWNGNVVYDKTDPEQREYVKVSTSSGDVTTSTTGSLSLKSTQWSANANQYSTLKTTFKIIGTYDGVVTVDIRKDVFIGTDTNIQSQKHQITGTDTEITVDTAFTSPNSGEWIFVRVTPNIYDNTDRDSRKAQGTEIQVTGGGTTPQPTPGYTTQPTPYTTQPPVQGTSTLTNIGFTTGNDPQIGDITVNKGQTVNVYANIYTTGYASGTVLIQINKDIVMDMDSTFKSFTQGYTLNNAGNHWVYVGSFSPDRSTSTSPFPGTLREYFGRGSTKTYGFEYDPQDENTRSRVYVN